jgi:hypothetical protein
MTKVLALYYSSYGHIETMANATAPFALSRKWHAGLVGRVSRERSRCFTCTDVSA